MGLNKNIDLQKLEYTSYYNCTFCQSENISIIKTIDISLDLCYFYCKNCKVSFTNKQLTEKSTKNLYLNYYKDHHSSTGIDSKKLAEHLSHFFLKNKLISSEIKILDFGGGDGSVALGLGRNLEKKFNYNIQIDVFDISNLENRIKQVNYINDENQIHNNKYDIIIASAVLEHVNDPKKTLNTLFNSLKTNGYFYARTPYKLPIELALNSIGIKKNNLQFPWHLFDMGREFWNNIPSFYKTNFSTNLKLIISRPSLVQTSFKRKKKKFILAYLLKIPGYFLKKWNYVGGWEVFIQKTNE
jgi:SAM-dependent methyltransferase